MRREANAQSRLTKYIESFNRRKIYFYHELKQTTTDTYHFSFEKQQRPSLAALERKGTACKWSDLDIREKPCDGASLPPLPAYVIIKFPSCFCMIPRSKFEQHAAATERKSITLQEAKHIAFKILK